MPTRPIKELIARQKVLAVADSLTVSDVARQMKAAGVGAAMVVDGGKLTGIFTERDALFRVIAAGKDPATTRISEVMTSDPITVHPDKPFSHAMHLMHDNGFRHVPVVADGRPVGMVSARDALSQEVAAFEAELRQRDDITEILG
jgi:CBS domain-containing protein